MNSLIKKIFKVILKRIGLEMTRIPKNIEVPPKVIITPYEASLLTMLSYQKILRIVVVGANDGYYNDPIYRYNKTYNDRTEVLLIEPQVTLIPILKKNYSFHPAHYVYNGAVGTEGSLNLYYINPDYWKFLKTPAHAIGWPEYRAPSGITSSNKEHVINYLQKFYPTKLINDEVIIELNTKFTPLINIINETGYSTNVDVLQIDVEGFEDEVIYNSNIDYIKPKIILFEISNLKLEKLEKLEKFLKKMGYVIENLNDDAIAFLAEFK